MFSTAENKPEIAIQDTTYKPGWHVMPKPEGRIYRKLEGQTLTLRPNYRAEN